MDHPIEGIIDDIVEKRRSRDLQNDDTYNDIRSWRDVLPVHPAAELFPMMSELRRGVA